MLQKVAILSVTYLQITGAASAECRDLHGRRIAQGIHYVPGPDACTLCVCDSGNPKWCKAVLCTPPQDCKSFRVGNSCCEFICLDDTLSKNDGVLDLDVNTDLGLRLVASAITAILSLSLLFFLIHRLRQRKILRGRQNRQLSEDERSLGSIGYIAGSIGYLQGSMGYLGNGSNDMEFHYEEPPSHYPLWKPPGHYFPRGEAPPPYEEAVAAARAEAALIATQYQLPTIIAAPSRPATPVSTITTNPIQTVPTVAPVPTRADISTNTVIVRTDNKHVCNKIERQEPLRHDYGHRTIPKNFQIDAATSVCSRQESDFKTLPKRPITELRNIIRSDVYYEDITPPPSTSSHMKKEVHRTIPRQLSSSGLSTKSIYNIPQTNVTLPSSSRPTHYSIASSIISLPISPVPPPGVFGNPPEKDTVKIKCSITATNGRITAEVSQPPVESTNDVESSLDGSYQCLHQNIDDEDYRSECENCKSAHGSRYYLAEDDEDELSSPNETMTLQRRPIETQTDTIGHGPTYYRTSLTLPTNTKKLRSTSMHGTPSNQGAREAWFSSMPESTSSEED